MLNKKNILHVIICFGCERLLLTYAEMDVYVHTALTGVHLTGVHINSEIFHSFGNPPQFQGLLPWLRDEPPWLQGEPPQLQGEPPRLQGEHPRLQGEHPRLQGIM